MKILTTKEENLLTTRERIEYYRKLREYLLSTKHQNLSGGSLTICPIINPLVRQLLNKSCGYDISIEGINVMGLNGIYAHTHQDKYDHVNLVVSNPNHTIILNSKVLSPLYKMLINLNGVVYVDKQSRKDMNVSKLEMMRLLFMDKSITMFPESCYNVSPNKLLLPMRWGVVNLARVTGLPIIPVVQRYYYKHEFDGAEHIDYVRVRYGNPIYVSPADDLIEKLEEYRTALSTMIWEMIDHGKLYDRRTVTAEYVDYLEFTKKNLHKAGIDIKVEETGIYGVDDYFYTNHYINAVDYDSVELISKEKPMILVKR